MLSVLPDYSNVQVGIVHDYCNIKHGCILESIDSYANSVKNFFKFLGNILLFFYLSTSKMAYSDDFLKLSNVIMSSTCICKKM